MTEKTSINPLITDHRGSIKEIPVIRSAFQGTERKVVTTENPLASATAQLDDSIVALVEYYLHDEISDEEIAIKYLDYLDQTIITIITGLENTGRITPDSFQVISHELDHKITGVKFFSAGKSPVYLDALTNLQHLLSQIKSSSFQKNMFSLAEASFTQIRQSINDQRKKINELIASRPAQLPSEQGFELAEGEIDFSMAASDDDPPLGLEELLG